MSQAAASITSPKITDSETEVPSDPETLKAARLSSVAGATSSHPIAAFTTPSNTLILGALLGGPSLAYRSTAICLCVSRPLSSTCQFQPGGGSGEYAASSIKTLSSRSAGVDANAPVHDWLCALGFNVFVTPPRYERSTHSGAASLVADTPP